MVYFADYVLTSSIPNSRQDFRGALAALHAATLKAQPGAASFAALPSEKQIAVMKTMEKPPGSAEATNGLAAASGLGAKMQKPSPACGPWC